MLAAEEIINARGVDQVVAERDSLYYRVGQRKQGSASCISASKRVFNGRIAAILGNWLTYGLAFIPMHSLLGPSPATLSLVRVTATGWFLGLRPGLIAGLAAFPVLPLLLLLRGEPAWKAMTSWGGLPGSFPFILAGGTVGTLHDKIEEERQERQGDNEETGQKRVRHAHD